MAAGLCQCGLFSFSTCARLLSIFLLCCAELAAIDPRQPLSQMHHAAWAGKEGVIGEVLAIAQTTDGFLWLGTTGGLLRFDGSMFERYKPEFGSFPDPNWVSALLATPDGGLWIGSLSGGASFLKSGRVTNYGEPDGMPPGRVRNFAADDNGIIWAATSGGLASFNGRGWQWVGKNGSPSRPSFNPPSSVAVDRQGVWVSNSKEGVFLRRTGAREFEQVMSQAVTGYLPTFTAAKKDMLLWEPESLILLRFRSGPEKNPSSREVSNSAGMFLFDRDGSEWLMTRGHGVLRIPMRNDRQGAISPNDPSIEAFSENEGLTSSTVYCAMEDREGDIWVGTLGGLDRFRARNATWTELEGTATNHMQLVAGDKGDVWASSPKGLWNVRNGKAVPKSPAGIQFSFRDPADGAIWFSTEHAGTIALWRWIDRKFFKLRSPALDWRSYRSGDHLKDKWVSPRSPVRALTRDGAGALWISVRGLGVYRQENGGWDRIEVLKGEPYITAFGATADCDGRVWLAYPERNAVAMWDRGAIRVFSPDTGLSIGPITQIAYSAEQIWAGGESGLAFYKDGTFHSIKTADGAGFGMVVGIAGASSSGLWVITPAGIVHIPQEEVSAVVRDRQHRVLYEIFDPITDLEERPSETSDTPAVMGSDGILWFATPRGVIRIDPAHLHRNLVPPQVSIRSVTANGKSFSVYHPVIFPPGATTVRIDYSVLSLSIPDKAQSRYRLLGADKEWQDEGNRGQAEFHNLRPGQYTFQVIARNSDGVWNNTGASLDFAIRSAFYQTVWFKLLYPALGAVLIWPLYRLRLRHVTARVQFRYTERLAERTRIARELHDTLLQSLAGVSLQLDGVAKQAVVDPERFIDSIDEVREKVDDCFVEARAKVWTLRSTSLEGPGLAATLQEFCERMRPLTSANCEFHLAGEPQSLAPEFEEELLRIAQEAVHNASRHAKAKRISVALAYTKKSVLLTISDDGQGFDTQEGFHKSDHWGLKNMQERAAQIRATYTLTSAAGKGTQIEVRVSIPA